MLQQSQKQNTSRYTYGPVPSRRLGLSLGIDIVPHKHCSYDCIYCQLGKTTNKTTLRKEYTPTHEILHEIKDMLNKDHQIDFLTFSGCGEPTLHKDIGYLIDELKKLTNIPVAVLTNGSLLHLQEVRNDLKNADVVIPTLCTADKDTFQKIHRGHASVDIEKVIDGYVRFREMYHGQLWLELMLMRDINDSPEQINNLMKVIDKIHPDKIHLNTVVRPPSEKCAHPVSLEAMQRIQDMFGEKCEIIVDFKPKTKDRLYDTNLEKITAMISRRPLTLDDLVKTTNLSRNELLECVQLLLHKGKIEMSMHDGKQFYKPRGTDD